MNAGLDFLNEIKEIHIPRDLFEQYTKFFTMLEKNNFTMSSWMLQTFWENTRDPIFRISFLKRTFDFCNKLFAENKNPNEIPYRYLNLLLTIFILTISYKFDSDSNQFSSTSNDESNDESINAIGNALIHHESLNRYIQSWFSLATVHTNTFFPELFDAIHKKFKKVEVLGTPFFHKAFQFILDKQKIPIVDYSIPLFTIYIMFSYLKRNPVEIESFTKVLKMIISSSLSLRKLKILLHIIYLSLIFFPGTIKSDIAETITPLLGKSGFVSLACAELGSNIQKEKHYPGYTFYLKMNDIVNINLAFSGNVPTFLISSSNFVDLFLFNSYPECTLPMSIVSFSRFYLKTKFQSDKEFSIQELLEFSSKLEFSSENSSEIAKMYNIQYKDRKKTKTSDESEKKEKKSESKRRSKKTNDLNSITFPTQPFMKYQVQKLSVDSDINSVNLDKYEDGKSIYTTNISFIFQIKIFKIIENFIKSSNSKQLQEYHILLIGDDILIGNALLAIIKAHITMKETFSKISLIFHIVPDDDTKSNQIADFISYYDPIYKLLVRHLYPITCSVSPTINQESKLDDIPLILDLGSNDENYDKNRFDNTIWFGNPSPFNMFNFGIQHYLQFARNSIDVVVWKCVIYYRDETKQTVVVPFISSIQIGQAFSLTSQLLIAPSMQNQMNGQNGIALSSQNSSNVSSANSNEAGNTNEQEQEIKDESAFISASLECNSNEIGMKGILLAKNESKIKTRENYEQVDIDKFVTVLPKNSNDENEDDMTNQPTPIQSSASTAAPECDANDFPDDKKPRRKTAANSVSTKKQESNNTSSTRPKRESMNSKNTRKAVRNNSFSPQLHTDNIDVDDSDSFIMVINNCSGKTIIKTTKVTSIAFWNANADLRVSPSDKWLMMEYTSSSKIKFNNESSRIENADKLFQELVTQVTVNCINDNYSFNAVIDQSVYGPLKKISIEPFLCDYEKDNRMKMRFATFSPYM